MRGEDRNEGLLPSISPLMIAIVMGLIADLDSPRERIASRRISQPGTAITGSSGR
jgi:hypothetical protein